jgi:hypothetical protein
MLTYAALYLAFITVVCLYEFTNVKTIYDLFSAIVVFSANAVAFYAVGHALGWF